MSSPQFNAIHLLMHLPLLNFSPDSCATRGLEVLGVAEDEDEARVRVLNGEAFTHGGMFLGDLPRKWRGKDAKKTVFIEVYDKNGNEIALFEILKIR